MALKEFFAEIVDADVGTLRGTTEAEQLAASDLLGGYPGRVRGIANGEVVASVNPTDSTTPVQDALDAVLQHSSRGRVVLPPATVEESGTLQGLGEGIQLVGHVGQRRIARDLEIPHLVGCL